jgi:hypothetical protein
LTLGATSAGNHGGPRNRHAQPAQFAADTVRMTIETALWLGALSLPAGAVAHFHGVLAALTERLLRLRKPLARA